MERETHTIDATGKSMGRLSSEVAQLLLGKHKASFQKHKDMGDAVIVENVSKMVLTGKKLDQKMYYRHTFYPGNLKETSAKKLMQTNPQKMFKDCVRRMLPDNKLRPGRLKRLTVK
jgi:large subunit ribosomal protein L13